MFQTPILFLIFNRPDTTKAVFESIRAIKPLKLYIAADGARINKFGEDLLVEETRAIIQSIDWDCEVKTLFRTENLGCKIAVSSAINWFFENEEQGIILEDDCLPNQSFFYYCEELLDLYKSNSKIMHIGGVNFQNGKKRGNASYYFTSYNHVWGWATWRRAWCHYDINLNNLKQVSLDNLLKNKFSNESEIKYWKLIYSNILNDNISTWDYQWLFSIWANNGMCISPNINLIKNIGFNSVGTHTVGNDILGLGNMELKNLNTLIHSQDTEINKNADNYVFRNFIKPPIYLYLFKKLIYLINK
ncbi:MAG: nucleotide-diphospho-sugar transferase [Candidatus Methylacidiphilales bacterium]